MPLVSFVRSRLMLAGKAGLFYPTSRTPVTIRRDPFFQISALQVSKPWAAGVRRFGRLPNQCRQNATHRPAITGSAQISTPATMLKRTQTETGICVNADRRAAQSSRLDVSRMAAPIEIKSDRKTATGSAGPRNANARHTHVVSTNRLFRLNCRRGARGASRPASQPETARPCGGGVGEVCHRSAARFCGA